MARYSFAVCHWPLCLPSNEFNSGLTWHFQNKPVLLRTRYLLANPHNIPIRNKDIKNELQFTQNPDVVHNCPCRQALASLSFLNAWTCSSGTRPASQHSSNITHRGGGFRSVRLEANGSTFPLKGQGWALFHREVRGTASQPSFTLSLLPGAR